MLSVYKAVLVDSKQTVSLGLLCSKTFQNCFSRKHVAFLNCVYCITEFLCEDYCIVSFHRASSVSSSRVESVLCHQIPCVMLWLRPLKMSSASSWALWMMQQSVLYVWPQRKHVYAYCICKCRFSMYLRYNFVYFLFSCGAKETTEV